MKPSITINAVSNFFELHFEITGRTEESINRKALSTCRRIKRLHKAYIESHVGKKPTKKMIPVPWNLGIHKQIWQEKFEKAGGLKVQISKTIIN